MSYEYRGYSIVYDRSADRHFVYDADGDITYRRGFHTMYAARTYINTLTEA